MANQSTTTLSSVMTNTTKVKTGTTEEMGLVPNSTDQKPSNSDSMPAADYKEMRNGYAPVAQPSKDQLVTDISTWYTNILGVSDKTTAVQEAERAVNEFLLNSKEEVEQQFTPPDWDNDEQKWTTVTAKHRTRLTTDIPVKPRRATQIKNTVKKRNYEKKSLLSLEQT